jgi:hypothetical protein
MALVAAPRQIGAARERQHIQKRIGSWLRTGSREAEPRRYIDGTLEGREILFRTGHFGYPTWLTFFFNEFSQIPFVGNIEHSAAGFAMYRIPVMAQ